MAENNQDHAGNASYDENFYQAIKDGSYRSASIILSHVTQYIRPRTVVDVGCGVGTWLAVWKKNFSADVYGIDGNYVDRSQLFIEEENFHPANLEEKITLEKRFDLAESLEVAEHLLPARAESFVEDLIKLSDVILFSAAIPGQGGVNHVNEQFQSYWAEKFLKHSYVALDFLRPHIWKNNQVELWYRQNIFVYVNSTKLYRYPELQKYYLEHRKDITYDTIHPDLWIDRLRGFQNFYNQVMAQVTHQNAGGGVR